MTSDLDLLVANPVRFTPPSGPDGEWSEVQDWTDDEWAHWMREHNKRETKGRRKGHRCYPYLREYPESEIQSYLQVDRNAFGLGFKRGNDKNFTWFYRPTPVAVPAHSTKLPNILFGGAAGGSKSTAARHEAYRYCLRIPDFRAIIMRRTFEELKRNHLDRAVSECARFNDFLGREVAHVVKSEHEIIFENHQKGHDSKIIFGHCQNLGDEERYLGDEYDFFSPDEAGTFIKAQVMGVAGRLRSTRRGFVPKLFATGNPGGANTLWLKQYYIDKLKDEIRRDNPRYDPAEYAFIQAHLWDNPYLMDPDGTYTRYENKLFELNPQRRLQLLLGDWSVLSGQFFPEFSQTRHVLDLPIPPGCKIERWVDWGYDPHYGICLFVAIFPNGRIYVFGEYRFNGAGQPKLVAADVAKKLKYLTETEYLPLARSTRINKSIADPSMWSGDGHSGEDYAQTFRRCGVMLQPGDNERVMGWGRLRHWFGLAPDGLPWMVFHPRCTTTTRTIPTLVMDEHDPDDVDTTGEDHPADTLRYGVMARPSPAVSQLPYVVAPAGSAGEIMRDLMRGKVSGPGMVR